MIVAGVAVGSVVFRLTADFGARPDVSIVSMREQLLASPLESAFDAVGALWRSVIGAPASALAAIRISWGEKSTLAALLWGMLTAGLLVLNAWNQDTPPARDSVSSTRAHWLKPALLTMALAAALLPEFVRRGLFYAGSRGSVELFSTRFYLQATPIAACLTVWILQASVRGRTWFLTPALIGLIAGHSAFLHGYSEYRKEAIYPRLGSALEPFVRARKGITVAILPEHYDREYTVTYKTTRLWPEEEGRKLWILWEGRMPTYLKREPGRASACNGPGAVNFNANGIRRNGPIAQLLWVGTRNRR